MMKSLTVKNNQVFQAIIKKLNDFYLCYSFNMKINQLNSFILLIY